MTRTPWRRLAAALLSLVPLVGCGIQESDVVEAGGAATVAVHPTGGVKLLLFLVGPNGNLMPVARDLGLSYGPDGQASVVEGSDPGRIMPTRPSHDGYRVATDKVLGLLLEGPDERERAAGLTTRLTLHGAGAPHAEPQPGQDGGPPVLGLRLAARVRDLEPVAVRQLVCTAAFAEDLGSAVPVVISGTDGSLPATSCELD
ncbi:hypothetical protein [Streptomyces sp. NPDC053431]|uniref:hypothetical protein n=1 Tax=Streptomyces sp. NPDC053431 TaxID=3365703 RepID=UPI0037D53180